ncbi:hypothetical protein PRUPE_2G197200 [Prunus persica]|uniref:RRM domain-containing protein n=1 Tax=Prunus persica TaxID=3760 RepID=A0A251QIG4_PRUPE|nr:UBP1-associated proteins 1A isoform X1 [Prunus persica]ONI23592.1 hypothetical protein PRUPE_2G197200 [Prunus persica]
MSQPRQFQMVGSNINNPGQYNDTTFTKIFVGGLAWETQRETMRRYFEQFGEILEAVVITDKNTGRSKGYGFVTFKDSEAAMRACQNPSPVIDGRRANCNLASLGAQKTRPPTPHQQHGAGRFRPAHGLVAPPAYHGSSSPYFHQPTGQYTFPYSAYGIIIVFMVVNNSHLITPQLGHQGQLACTKMSTHYMLSMHRAVARLMVLEFNIPKWYSTHICLISLMLLVPQLGFSLFLLQCQLPPPQLPPQVQQQQQQLVLVLLHKPLQPILNRILQLKCLQREKKKTMSSLQG